MDWYNLTNFHIDTIILKTSSKVAVTERASQQQWYNLNFD